MKLSIIIPTKDRISILNRTIENLVEAIKGLDVEIIIVNDSHNAITLIVNSDNIVIIDNPKSGAASARNSGVKKSSGELLLFLDDDIIVNNSNILKTISLHQNKIKVAFNFFWIYPPDLIESLRDTSFGRYSLNAFLFTNTYRSKINGRINSLIEENGLTSQYFSILKSDFLLTGGYDESLPFAGIEDYVLFKELKKNNVKVFLSTSDIVYQNESDRISLFSVMERHRRGAITIKKAIEIGHKELKLDFSSIKKITYFFLVKIKNPIFRFTEALPNKKYFDILYFKLVKLLLGLSSHDGYYNSDSKK
jgi:glycosyltransferase involved in cell wall biosynthesis